MSDISLVGMCLGALLLLMPAFVLHRYKTGLVKDLFVAALRMTVQLFLVGFYLKYMFLYDKAWLNMLWVIVMSVVASATMLSRVKISNSKMLLTFALAFFTAVIASSLYFVGLVVGETHLFAARYFVPICGMMLGNMLSSNVIAINTFADSIQRERTDYLFRLANGASPSEACAPYVRSALVRAFNPTIAQMAVMGLISMPGTMTGQILGGASPDVAIRYQIVLMMSIFSVSMLSAITNLYLFRKLSKDIK